MGENYLIEYWREHNDCADNEFIEVYGKDEADALSTARAKTTGKLYRIIEKLKDT